MTQLWHLKLITDGALDDQRMRGQHKEVFQVWDCIVNNKKHATVQYAIDHYYAKTYLVNYHAILLWHCDNRGLFRKEREGIKKLPINPEEVSVYESIFSDLDNTGGVPSSRFFLYEEHDDELYEEHCRNIKAKQLEKGYILNGQRFGPGNTQFP